MNKTTDLCNKVLDLVEVINNEQSYNTLLNCWKLGCNYKEKTNE